MTKAIVLGATGLVGGEIVETLLADEAFDRVVSLGRRPSGKAHDKLEEHAIDFAKPETFASIVEEAGRSPGAILFSSLGTTIRKAGSQEAQRAVDVDAPLAVARVAAKAGFACAALVSALGAKRDSSIFYNRIKGELEEEIQALGFSRVRIVRPSILLGERGEQRPMEAIGATVSKAFAFIPGLKRYRPIPGATVARALVRAAKDETPGARVLELDAIFELGAVFSRVHG